MRRDAVSRFVRRHQDPLLAVALAVTAQVEIWAADTLTTEDRVLSAPLALVGTLALIWRRRIPLVVLGVLLGAFFLATIVVPISGEDPIASGIALVAAIYSVGAHSGGRWAVAGAVAILDVVAHAISVIVLQARGGCRLLASEPDEARGAFDSIESQGQQALGEMRRLLGMLRQGDEELALAPQPSLASLDALAAQVSAAGLPVEVTVQGERRELPPGVDVSGFRIVQEALTNALKHAGPATARVVVRYGDDHLEVEVLDTGHGNGADGGGGHGLIGMHERAALYGGEVVAGRRSGGGFAVRVRLPLDSAVP